MGVDQSILANNTLYFNNWDNRNQPTDISIRTAAQIVELNCCLDGQADCGLNHGEIVEILGYISTL